VTWQSFGGHGAFHWLSWAACFELLHHSVQHNLQEKRIAAICE